MPYHKLLKLQFNKCHLDDEHLPSDLSSWKLFIECINRSYVNNDNDQYLLERSMQLSSDEMKKLNEMLVNAHKIAKMGYWSYDLLKNEIIWSKQAYYIFGIESVDNLDGLYALVAEEHKKLLQEKLDAAVIDGQNFECEVLMKGHETENKFKWHRIIAKPNFDKISKEITSVNFVSIDITSKKIAEDELTHLSTQLIISARRAGMADIATSVLHNIGNILNSSNVSLGIISENINNDSINKLATLKELVANNLDNIGEFISSDKKGKLIPPYFIALVTKIHQLHETIRTEIKNMNEQLQHIKEITHMQRDISGVSNVNESIHLNELIDTAIIMCDPAIESRSIKIIKKYHDNIIISSDRSKILQILVNLIKNAKESVLSITDNRDKVLQLTCRKKEPHLVEIKVEDNGIGISKEIIGKIYTLGFTTKKEGHGFGMHSSSLAAKELKGELIGTSDGIDKGAVFSLILPVTQEKKGGSHERRHELENYSY